MIRNKVQQFFDENEITIATAHKATGISRSSLTRIYRNEIININMDTVDAICDAYKCKFDDLFEYIPEDQMTKDDHVKLAERRLHVEYHTKLRRKGKKKTESTEAE